MERFLEMGFQELYPVNPGESEILGVNAYRTVVDIPGPVDLAHCCYPNGFGVSRRKGVCFEKGAGSCGYHFRFRRDGEKGKELEQRDGSYRSGERVPVS